MLKGAQRRLWFPCPVLGGAAFLSNGVALVLYFLLTRLLLALGNQGLLRHRRLILAQGGVEEDRRKCLSFQGKALLEVENRQTGEPGFEPSCLSSRLRCYRIGLALEYTGNYRVAPICAHTRILAVLGSQGQCMQQNCSNLSRNSA